MIFPYLLVAFIAMPIAEIWLLLKVGSAIGGGTTILIVIFTATIGAYLVRQQGFATWRAVQNQMNSGRVPAMEMAEGLALLIAGAVLLTPGFLTDAFGFALLTPPIRRWLIHWLTSQQNVTVSSVYTATRASAAGRPNSRRDTVIEGEYSERE